MTSFTFQVLPYLSLYISRSVSLYYTYSHFYTHVYVFIYTNSISILIYDNNYTTSISEIITMSMVCFYTRCPFIYTGMHVYYIYVHLCIYIYLLIVDTNFISVLGNLFDMSINDN